MSFADAAPIKIGFIPASRGFFSADLARRMRQQTIDAFADLDIDLVTPSEEETKNGCVETRDEAEKVGALFRAHGVSGILVGAVNFGDEQGAAQTIRAAGLSVPVMLFGCQEESTLRPGMNRRDAFCGLLSIADALRQNDIPYSLGKTPIGYPTDDAMQRDFAWFAGVCRVVAGVRRARYGQVGARPDAFWTCRFDERQLQRLGPTAVTMDLSELLQKANALKADAPATTAAAADMQAYADTSATPAASLDRIARLDLALRKWIHENELEAVAIQCWTSIQLNYGVCACSVMSKLINDGTPAACEADILGALSMHAAQLASGRPAALADWNNLHNDDHDLVNLWHCGVFPKSFAKETPILRDHDILVGSGAVPVEQGHGIVEMRLREMPVTLSRAVQTPDGGWRMLIVEAAIEDDPASTTGSFGWCRIPGLMTLYRDTLLRHYPHHVAFTEGHCGDILAEACGRYLGMHIDHHPAGA